MERKEKKGLFSTFFVIFYLSLLNYSQVKAIAITSSFPPGEGKPQEDANIAHVLSKMLQVRSFIKI